AGRGRRRTLEQGPKTGCFGGPAGWGGRKGGGGGGVLTPPPAPPPPRRAPSDANNPPHRRQESRRDDVRRTASWASLGERDHSRTLTVDSEGSSARRRTHSRSATKPESSPL